MATSFRKTWSIHGRLTGMLLLGAGMLLLLAALVLRWLTGAWLRQEFDDALLAKTRALVTLTRQEASEVELDFADEYMPEFEREEQPEYFQLWLADATVIERSSSLGELDLPRVTELSEKARFRDLELPDGRRGRLVQVDFVPQVDDDEGMDVDVPLDPRGLEPDSGYRAASIGVARSHEALDTRLVTLSLSLMGFSAVLLGAIGVMIRVALRYGLQPVGIMARQVRELDAESLDTRLDLASPPIELQPILEQLNGLLDRLESAFARERRLSSNLAHELRTPISELRNVAEVGGRWPEDVTAVREYFGDVREIALQMERIVVHLLALARFEGGTEAIENSRFALADLITSCWRSVANKAGGTSADLHLDIAENLEVVTDRGKLELMVTNLLSNALTYQTPGHAVTCHATRDTSGVTMTVSNHTEGLTENDLPLLFDRFWRKDSARTGGQHAGLGLTLVRAFAQLLDIGIDTHLASDRTFRISLVIPHSP